MEVPIIQPQIITELNQVLPCEPRGMIDQIIAFQYLPPLVSYNAEGIQEVTYSHPTCKENEELWLQSRAQVYKAMALIPGCNEYVNVPIKLDGEATGLINQVDPLTGEQHLLVSSHLLVGRNQEVYYGLELVEGEDWNHDPHLDLIERYTGSRDVYVVPTRLSRLTKNDVAHIPVPDVVCAIDWELFYQVEQIREVMLNAAGQMLTGVRACNRPDLDEIRGFEARLRRRV